MSVIVSSLSPYGIGSAERGNTTRGINDVALYSSKGKGYYPKALISQGREFLDKYHIMISKVTSEHAGEPSKEGNFKVISKMQVLKPDEVCTFSYFLIGNFDSEEERDEALENYYAECEAHMEEITKEEYEEEMGIGAN
jgi:site-specific DNA-methyltransferase (adenine-specific)